MLPQIKRVPLQKQVFPRNWQTVIFRNYGLVSTEKIAQVLACDEATVVCEARRLGLGKVEFDECWEKRGFITIVRNNWYLLPYSQLMTLLGYDEARLEFVLEKEDFLNVKLGNFKPECEEVIYAPLTAAEIEETERLAETVKKYVPSTVRPFEFFSQTKLGGKAEMPAEAEDDNIRLIHGYLTPCGDAFVEDGKQYLPDALLAEYQKQGINGVWVHGVLSSLSPYPFDPSLSEKYSLRRKNLQELVDRARAYGIKVYLYINEPRGLPEEKLGKYAYLAGHRENGSAALCFEHKEVREYLYTALKDLFTEVKGLGGIITITMSENLTHCNYRQETNCPVCKNIPPEESASAVNNVMMRALRDSGSGAKLLAYLWGWSPIFGWTDEQIKHGIELLDKDVIALCASEYDLAIEKGGVKSRVVDYSISNPGPSDITKMTFNKARETGHACCAKIQTNNSWENSAMPYLPVFDLVLKHLENLDELGVHNYMLTWTLGGYPSPMLDLVAKYSADPKGFSLDRWYKDQFGKNAETVQKAAGLFCEGFKEYPFSLESLYLAPKTLGPANFWDLKAEEKESTMVCFAFDDYENWISPYPYEVYVSQYEKLLSSWEKGLSVLENAEETPLIKALTECAKAAYLHFRSDWLQTRFSHHKRDIASHKQELAEILADEKSAAEQLLALAAENPAIGFEASNHYFYNDRNLTEKIMQTTLLEEELNKM